MNSTVLSWLRESANNYKDKLCYRDSESSLTFSKVWDMANSVGNCVADMSPALVPIGVMAARRTYTPACYLGIAMAGCFYAPMDGELPEYRLSQILGVCRPKIMLVDKEHEEKAKELIESYNAEKRESGSVDETIDCEIALIDDIIAATPPAGNPSQLLCDRMDAITEETPLYCIFTSGSSGVPKGVLTSHGAVCRYLDGLNQVIGIDDTDVIGGQAPLDYIAAIRDMYLPLMTGCETVFIPKNTFAMPEELFGALNENKVTTICWSATGVEIPARLGAFETIKPEYIKRVVFSGSVISSKLLAIWQENLPDAMFVNQYGPTEATGSCTYYVIDEKVDENTVLPIGKPFKHYEVFLLNEDDEVLTFEECAANPSLSGEICVAGSTLALAYYGAEELTKKSFPYIELKRIYRTGDIGTYNEDGELMFLGRKDRQIKHMGHRIELEEIEQMASKIEGVSECASVYDQDNKLIYLFYTGDATSRDITIYFRSNMPAFMVPRKLVELAEMPHLPNGKINMPELKKMM